MKVKCNIQGKSRFSWKCYNKALFIQENLAGEFYLHLPGNRSFSILLAGSMIRKKIFMVSKIKKFFHMPFFQLDSELTKYFQAECLVEKDLTHLNSF